MSGQIEVLNGRLKTAQIDENHHHHHYHHQILLLDDKIMA